MSKPPAISVSSISKSYGTFKAVNDLTFEVRHGEIFALLGPNGAGKSTTIRMILDIIRPDTGSIQVFGAPLNDVTKDRIGYLPEERGLYKSVPLIEMLTYLGKLKGLTGAEAQKRGMALLEKMDLGEYAKKKADDLSKGMQQKVQFIVTILHEPDLIIIDEPFSGLDPINRLVIKNLLMDFRERGGSIVMSTHQMNQVEEMADRMLMISRGEQKLYGEVDTIRRQFATHAIVVQGKGDWAALPGVIRVEQSNNGREGFILHLAENITADDVLVEIARSQNMTIEKFELAIPNLDDIFIRVAGKDAAV
jgi:ABC-2 type transport system ATP-binding protein